jgi:hypothetical protein
MSYHYSVPPPGYVVYDYSSTSTSPSPDNPAYDYYRPYHSPASSPAGRTPTKRQHVRTASFGTPRAGGWHSPAGFPSPGYYTAMPGYTSSPAAYDNVSRVSPSHKPNAQRFSASGHGHGGGGGGGSNIHVDPVYAQKRRASLRSQTHHIYVDVVDDAHDRDQSTKPVYLYTTPRSASYSYSTKPRAKADPRLFSSQVPVYDQVADDTPVRSRVRRASTSTRPKTATPSSPKKPLKPAAVATAEDAAAHRIPTGYSLKNWDPTEKPILLLGSVFDANSVGKWIYDWTVYHHKPGSPLTEVAGELWLLLIKFAGKMKRAEDGLARLRGAANVDLVGDFIASGERIWRRLKDLIKYCEEYMWAAAKKEGGKGKIQMGEKSGIEFVKSIFGRDRELEQTEVLMQSIRMWSLRFDSNCEDVLRARKSTHH